MFYKTDKHLSQLSPQSRGSDRAHLSGTLGIQDEGELVTLDTNLQLIEKDPDWSYEVTSRRLQIRPHPGDGRAILHQDDFSNLFPGLFPIS